MQFTDSSGSQQPLATAGTESPSSSTTFPTTAPQPHMSTLNTSLSGTGLSSSGATEVISPSLDKYGRLIQSRTGEKVYVGSSSMTLFGLEIQNMVPSFVSSSLLTSSSTSTTPAPSPGSDHQPQLLLASVSSNQEHQRHPGKRETKILEKEGTHIRLHYPRRKQDLVYP